MFVIKLLISIVLACAGALNYVRSTRYKVIGKDEHTGRKQLTEKFSPLQAYGGLVLVLAAILAVWFNPDVAAVIETKLTGGYRVVRAENAALERYWAAAADSIETVVAAGAAARQKILDAGAEAERKMMAGRADSVAIAAAGRALADNPDYVEWQKVINGSETPDR